MSDQQPDQVIDVPGVGAVAFPGSMTDAQINAAATKLYQGANPSKKQPPVKSWVDTAVEWLPTAGAFVGGAMGAEAGPLGMAAGAGAGGALGKAVQQKVDVMRGKAESPATFAEAMGPIASQGAQDALAGGVVGAGGAAIKAGASVAGPALATAGKALEQVGGSKALKLVSRGGAILYGMLTGDLRTAVEGGVAGPAAVRGVGKVMGAAGEALASKAASAKAVATRVARIPLAERLAQIPQQEIERIATPSVSTLADDVALIRESIAKKWTPSAAIKVVAHGDDAYADALRKAYTASVEKEGAPIPEAIQKLMKSGSFAQLPSDADVAGSVATRNTSGAWK